MASPPRKPTSSRFKVGDAVTLVKSGHGGRVAFQGTVLFRPGHWIGVILDRPFGLNNGTVKGVKYFECKPRYGIFVPVSAVHLVPKRRHSASDAKRASSSSRSARIAKRVTGGRRSTPTQSAAARKAARALAATRTKSSPRTSRNGVKLARSASGVGIRYVCTFVWCVFSLPGSGGRAGAVLCAYCLAPARVFTLYSRSTRSAPRGQRATSAVASG